ncbi:structure-specific endonuclease subunit SLX4 [Xenentodon cancila]
MAPPPTRVYEEHSVVSKVVDSFMFYALLLLCRVVDSFMFYTLLLLCRVVDSFMFYTLLLLYRVVDSVVDSFMFYTLLLLYRVVDTVVDSFMFYTLLLLCRVVDSFMFYTLLLLYRVVDTWKGAFQQSQAHAICFDYCSRSETPTETWGRGAKTLRRGTKYTAMDDSDQDFQDLCPRLLKRVRKKAGDPTKQNRKAARQTSSQMCEGDQRKRKKRRDEESGSSIIIISSSIIIISTSISSSSVSTSIIIIISSSSIISTSFIIGSSIISTTVAASSAAAASSSAAAAASSAPVSSAAASSSATAEAPSEGDLRAKDVVLLRMQQFKRANPQKMVHNDKIQPINHGTCHLTAHQGQKTSVSLSSGPSMDLLDNDEALALRLQQELDREAAEAQTVDLEDGGLFFCQICHRDLSHMTPEGRTQHLNRCLDENEESGPAHPPPSVVPDCPICGKKFKSQKSRSSHLKRCSSDMGVSPAVLLQALQRQAQESAATANALLQTVSTKRKGATNSGLPARKKPRKKPESLDEDTAVALALSSSVLEQEIKQHRGKMQSRLQTEAPALSRRPGLPHSKTHPTPCAGKGRGKRNKAAVPRPPPLLLVQDPQAALTRLQERVSALLLCSRPLSPSTPTKCASTLSGWTGTAPLWQKSTLLGGGGVCASDFYTAELKEFFTPWEAAKTSLSTCSKPESSVQGTPVTGSKTSSLPSCSQAASCSSAPSTPRTGQLPVGSQALRDLMELAEDGMTLTQYGYSAKVQHLSGFIQEDSEEQDDLGLSGFLPETAHKPSDGTNDQAARTAGQQDRRSHQSVALSRLASDLSSMVNNPQISDVQLQVDSGDVFYAHSFMVYARCPLLAEMVHESGFGVQEEGMPAARRVLLNDVPGRVVLALLQYLYTAHCSVPASLQPHLLELASRFDVQELQQLCRLQQEEAATVGDEVHDMNEEDNGNNQTDQAFMELLRSMWNEGDEDDTADSDGGGAEGRRREEGHAADEVTSGDREIHEEQVNEEELEEIYEFAATQKNKGERDGVEEEERLDEERDGDAAFTNLSEPKRDFGDKTLHPNLQREPDRSLDRGYRHFFSEPRGDYEEGDPSSTSGPPKACSPQSKQQQSPEKPPSELSGRIVFQSSGSLLDDLSLGAPPTISSLPIAGLSPCQVRGQGGCGDERENSVELDASLKQESHGPYSICLPPSPASPSKKEEPELIVLSDSSDEMEVSVLSPCKLSPPHPAAQHRHSFTEIRSRQNPVSHVATSEKKESRSLELSPGDALDCSPEVSWLVPSTPVQAAKSTRSSFTQTKSSMRRTQLFSKRGTSPPPSSLLSSSTLPVKKTLHANTSLHKGFGCSGTPESQVSRRKLNRKLLSSISSMDVNVCPKISRDVSKHHHHQCSSQASSKQDTPVHLQTRPYSSTPLHAELRQPPPPAASLFHTDADEQDSPSQQREMWSSASTEKTELGSFHLSPLSNPCDSVSGRLNSKRQSASSSQSLRSAESSVCTNTGVDPMRTGVRNEQEKREIDLCNESMGDGGEPEEGKENVGEPSVEESSFQQSFMAMDEPPIAFNDSWGLDICAEANPGCFSLRLEDSRGSSPPEPSPERRETAGSSPSPISKPPPPRHSVQTTEGHAGVTTPSPPQSHSSRPSSNLQAHKHPCLTPSPPDPTTRTSPGTDSGLLDSKIWGSWEEDEEEALPLSQRLNPPARVKTPVSSHSRGRGDLVPVTPMPHFSDMDTPELKNKLSRFGVRPLPKRKMVLKLKEIHQYTHQLASSDSEDEASSAGGSARLKPPPSRPVSCPQTGTFKEPRPPAASSLEGHDLEEDAEPLSASQGSNTSSAAASDESERSNPELIISSDGDSDSDGGISSSQAASRLHQRLQAVRSFILSDSSLYSQILQYQPLGLSQLQQQLKAAGIRLGAAKLVDYLDSQCITFTTAKPGHSAPNRRRGRKTSKGARGASRKKGASTML